MENMISVEFTAEELRMIKVALATRVYALEEKGLVTEADKYEDLRYKVLDMLKGV